LVTRRTFLKGALAVAGSTIGLGGYAFAIEPMWRLRVQRYSLTPAGWPRGLRLTAALIADIHAGEPQMSAARIRQIVARANALQPDIHLLLGDYAAGHKWLTRKVESDEWSRALSGLRAPMGVHAILGNHDWWDDQGAQRRGHGPVIGRKALEKHDIRVYENDVVRLTKGGQPFWLAGLGDQIALFEWQRRNEDIASAKAAASRGDATHLPVSSIAGKSTRRMLGVDNLPGTLAKITDDAPVILMAHEPDIFTKVPGRVALTVSGHTHGGQVRLLGYSPVVPSRYGNRYAYGHIVEAQNDAPITEPPRHLVVSGGLGCSILPVRFGMPPEIVLLDIGGEA
jgi:uncharacterized protein